MKASIQATLKGTKVPVIPRSAVQYDLRYTVQQCAPAGNWVDSLGTSDWNSAVDHAEYHEAKGRRMRIVDNSKQFAG